MKTKQSGTLAFMSSKSFAYRFSSYFASFLLLNLLVDGKVIELTNANFDKIIGSADVALVNFHAEWCRFSKMLVPVFSDASNVFPEPNIVFGSVDCDRETTLASKFHITKYPTLKLFRNGEMAKREYRGSRSVDAFTNFIRSQLVETIRHSNTEEELNRTLNESPNERIVYPDNLLNNVALKHWIHEKCIPLVREITFQNAEELTEEGRPFLILFYARDKRDIVKTYVNEVAKQLQDLKSSVNFLYADGHTFAHPLHHLGKSEKDLPLLAIDSFRHMYLFPSINDLTVPGKLRQFILDLQSGKLHRDFHNVPPSVETTPAPQSVSETAEAPVRSGPLTPAADSVFVKLKPANTRYTVLRDEL
ncbi:hypothetical protein M514_02733 [Trichuris suis]|uniref:Thioredoxin domain-containing protein n=1 Tax=Trichuris suis TaxID=68888 RepID=A0A085NH48_9BILA|nr:hypothetical protein M514_02733 [Trichuris suis]